MVGLFGWIGCGGEAVSPGDTAATTAPVVCVSGFEPAEDGCVPAGCGPDRWGGATEGVFVLPGGAGDGTRDAPFGTLADALAAGRSPVNLGALAEGTAYPEPLLLTHRQDGVEVVGRCPELVRLGGGIDADGSSTDGWSVRGLTVSEPGGVGVALHTGALTLSAVDVWGATGAGLVVYAGTLTVDGVDVADTRADDGAYGLGGEVLGGALVGARLSVRGAIGHGLIVDNPARLTLSDLVITDVRAGDGLGYGIVVLGHGVAEVQTCTIRSVDAMGVAVGDTTGGASATLLDCTVDGAHSAGVYAFGPGTTLRFRGEVSHTAPFRDGEAGVGIGADDGARVDVDAWTQNNEGPGLAAVGEGTEVVFTGEASDNQLVGLYAVHGAGLLLEEATVRDTVPRGGQAGYGVVIEAGAHGEVRGGSLSHNAGIGLYVGGAEEGEATLEVDGTQVDGTVPAPSAMGFGAQAAEGGVLVLTGARFDNNHQGGVIASGAAWATLTDVGITHTRKDLSSSYEVAVGLGCQDGATLDADRVEVSGTEGAGVVVVSGCVARLADPTVSANRYAGIVLGGGALTVTGGSVEGTVPDPGKGGGVGLLGQADGEAPRLLLDGVSVTDNTLGGLVFLDPGAWEVRGGVVAGAEPEVRGASHLYGQAVLAHGTSPWDGTSGLHLDGVGLQDSGGTAVLLDGGAATLDGVSWARVATSWPVDPVLVQQACTDTTPRVDPGSAPSARICVPPDVVVGEVPRFTGTFAEAEAVPL